MKRTLLAATVAVVLSTAFATAVVTAASDAPQASQHQVIPDTTIVAANDGQKTLHEHLLTISCGQGKGTLTFTDKELVTLSNVVEHRPDLTPRVCGLFTFDAAI